jgi:inorganic pyrophosphatase
MIDGHEADDKIIAVLENDNFWGNVQDISELPKILVERLEHYFSTYKMIPGQPSQVTIDRVIHNQDAFNLVTAAIQDYEESYGIYAG